MNDLTVAYITSRRQPRIEWFLDSLARQQDELLHIIVIHRFYMGPDDVRHSVTGKGCTMMICEHPKPNVWQGEHRLTKEDYFSAANARNTAAALCRTEWIAYVDDLSVLGPHWLASVHEAMAGGYIALGAYQKVRKLVVENGVAVSFEEYDGGKDTRWGSGADYPVPCAGTWAFGCSIAMPIEALLKINGWPEALCDGMGFEDCCTGAVLQNAGYQCRYDRRMFTFESEEDHHIEPAMKRSDFGVSPRDKSHKALEISLSSSHFDNDFNLRELRERTLAGEPFPVRLNPQHEWFSSTPLKDL